MKGGQILMMWAWRKQKEQERNEQNKKTNKHDHNEKTEKPEKPEKKVVTKKQPLKLNEKKGE